MTHFINARSHLESEEMKYMYSQWRERNEEEKLEVFIKPLSLLLPRVDWRKSLNIWRGSVAENRTK